MSQGTMKEVLKELENMRFPTRNPILDRTRMNVLGGKKEAEKKNLIEVFSLGLTRAYNRTELVESKFNRRFPKLHSLLTKLMKQKDPSYKFTSIQINKDVKTDFHTDKNNIDKSYCLSLGNFTGGALELKKGDKIVPINTKNRMVFYDGSIEHRTGAFKGTRYAIIWFRRK